MKASKLVRVCPDLATLAASVGQDVVMPSPGYYALRPSQVGLYDARGDGAVTAYSATKAYRRLTSFLAETADIRATPAAERARALLSLLGRADWFPPDHGCHVRHGLDTGHMSRWIGKWTVTVTVDGATHRGEGAARRDAIFDCAAKAAAVVGAFDDPEVRP